MQLFSLLGNSQKLDGGAMFGNVPRALWQRWMPPDQDNRIALACRALLARDLDGKNVLFEVGIGAFFEPQLKQRFGVIETDHVLLQSLADVGLTDRDIDVVVLSHLHFDHAGGLLSQWGEGQDPELLFPNATFVISRACWERAANPHPRDRASFIPALLPLLEASDRVELVDDERCEALGSSVRFSYSHGHTPGLMLAEIVGPGGQGGMVFCADLIPGAAWVHLPITMGYDRYPELLIDEKHEFLRDKLSRGVSLFFTHDPEVAAAKVAQDDRGRFGVKSEMAELAAWELS